MTTDNTYRPGLEGIVAAETTLSSVDGQKGELIIGGFPLEELAANATFEEICCLLWYGDLPNTDTLNTFKSSMASYRELPAATYSLLEQAAKHRVLPMDALRMAAGTFDLDLSGEDNMARAKAITARIPPAIATYWRFLNDQDPIPPRMDLGRSSNYLYMLTGREPGPATIRGLRPT
ncbi:MAG TPA: citrate/2-methylcitrate synthase [Acidimicrobiia bacterium]|nr:citrate/2-methylcitrate synthase [Acidimicrobiia bacterium]